jgi:hypothetical protein
MAMRDMSKGIGMEGKLKPYEQLVNTQLHKNAFVCGAGLSLQDVIQHPSFSEVEKHVVVCVNSSILAFDWSKGNADNRYWISNDSAVRSWTYWENVKKAKGHKIIRDSWSKYYDEIPDFYVFSPRQTPDGIIYYNETGLVSCSSVPSGIDLALQMGCSNVFLLGVDHYARNGKSHFWDLWEEEKKPKTSAFRAPIYMQEKIFNTNQKTYKALLNFAEYKKAKIYNCNLISAVKGIERIEFNTALEMVNG